MRPSIRRQIRISANFIAFRKNKEIEKDW